MLPWSWSLGHTLLYSSSDRYCAFFHKSVIKLSLGISSDSYLPKKFYPLVIIPQEAAIISFRNLWFIFCVLFNVMVLKNYYNPSSSPGLLPTPCYDPTPDLQAGKYIESSLFPVPYQAVVILEGCPLIDLISWDLSASNKAVKVKLEWSSDPKSSPNFKLHEKLPTNLVKALCLYQLTRPSWSMTSSSSKTTRHFEWSISSAISPKSSNISSTTNKNLSPFSSDSPKTPHQPEKMKFFDSGYQSNKSTVGCYDSKFENWRLKSSPVSNPKFSPSPNKKVHDVFKPSNKSSKAFKKNNSSKTVGNSSSKVSSELINSVSTLATTKSLCESHITKETDQHDESSVKCSQPEINSSKSSSQEDILTPNLDNYHCKPVSSPIPIDDTSLVHWTFDMSEFNATGRCRLCHHKVSSPFVDLHLTKCSKIPDRDMLLSSFLDETSVYFNFDRDTIKDLMVKCYTSQFTESDVPNELFKDKETFYSFFSELENLADLLSEKVFDFLKISAHDKYDILDYRKDNKTHKFNSPELYN